MKIRKLFLLLMLIFTAVTVLTAHAEDFVPKLDKNTEAEITVAGNYSNFEALEAAFDDFNRYYPEVELSYVRVDDYNNTIQLALTGESRPDIYFMQYWMIGGEAYKPLFDAAVDLSDPALDINIGNIREEILYVDPDGHVPFLPIFTSSSGFMANEAIFEKEGLKIPETYAELIEVSEKLKAAGYPGPITGFNAPKQLFYFLGCPDFIAMVKDDPEAIDKLNRMDPDAGEYMRTALEHVKDIVDHGMVDTDLAAGLENDYQAVILRFFEGDIPMMACSGDTFSGTEKRQSLSESYSRDPFPYSFHAFPSSSGDLWFLNYFSLAFAANKNSSEPEMTAEFMRFISRTEILNKMAQIKRLITPTKDFGLDGVYESFGKIPVSLTVNPGALGISDDVFTQFRNAVYAVGNGIMTVDEAIAAYGTLEE